MAQAAPSVAHAHTGRSPNRQLRDDIPPALVSREPGDCEVYRWDPKQHGTSTDRGSSHVHLDLLLGAQVGNHQRFLPLLPSE